MWVIARLDRANGAEELAVALFHVRSRISTTQAGHQTGYVTPARAGAEGFATGLLGSLGFMGLEVPLGPQSR